MKAAMLAGFVAVVLVACGDGGSARASVAHLSALEKMELAFVGDHSSSEIQGLMDTAFRGDGISRSEANYERYGSVLVRLRKDIGGATEFELLQCAIAGHAEYDGLELAQVFAVCSAALASTR